MSRNLSLPAQDPVRLIQQVEALADALERIKAAANRALHGDKSAYLDSLLAIRDLAHSAAGRLS